MDMLVDMGIAREFTDRRRNRLFAYSEYLSILSEGRSAVAPTGAGGVITSDANHATGRSGVTEKIQWGNPFDDAGIEEMADWMAPRLGQSPMYQMAIDGADPDLLAVLLER